MFNKYRIITGISDGDKIYKVQRRVLFIWWSTYFTSYNKDTANSAYLNYLQVGKDVTPQEVN